MPKSSIAEAISSVDSSAVFKNLSQFSLAHNSIRLVKPITTTSFFNSAYSSKLEDILILPCLSRVDSVAPDIKNLAKNLAFLLVTGVEEIFWLNNSHSSIGNIKRQSSSPLVATNLSPSSSLNLAGIITLPLLSILCKYSPININITLSLKLPPSTTNHHLIYYFNVYLKIPLMN